MMRCLLVLILAASPLHAEITSRVVWVEGKPQIETTLRGTAPAGGPSRPAPGPGGHPPQDIGGVPEQNTRPVGEPTGRQETAFLPRRHAGKVTLSA